MPSSRRQISRINNANYFDAGNNYKYINQLQVLTKVHCTLNQISVDFYASFHEKFFMKDPEYV